MPGLKSVFGAGGVRAGRGFADTAVLKEIYDILEQNGCKNIDTAALYGESEQLLGESGAQDRFILDTKTKGGFAGKGNATKENVIKDAENSKKMLHTNVDIFYIHAPDAGTPLEVTLDGVNEVYKSGFFKRFGLSNFEAEDVEKVYNICKEKGYPLPEVYQANYSAVARKQEEVLFPTLRKLGMSCYVYSPIAGGFLTKTKQDILDGKGRFDRKTPLGSMYSTMYAKPAYLEALDKWDNIAKDEGVSKAELAYRWVTYNCPLKPEYGDAIIFGASQLAQIKETLGWINSGPLSEKAVKAIDDVWKTIEHEAPLDNYNG